VDKGSWQKTGGLISLILVATAAGLSGCSIWQSEGRKFLEKEGLEFSATGLKNFTSYLQQNCSTAPESQAFATTLTGEFHIVNGDRKWELRTFSQEQGLRFQQHIVQIQPMGKKTFLYCYPILLKAPARQLSSQQIQQFFSSP